MGRQNPQKKQEKKSEKKREKKPEKKEGGTKVGATAAFAGVGVQTLHFYEREGLIEEPSRSAAGYRLYSRETVHRVRAIKRAQTLGFTLQEIRELIGIAEDRRPLGEVAAVAERRITDIDARIERLQGLRDALLTAVEQCRCKGDLSRCDVLARLSPDAPE